MQKVVIVTGGSRGIGAATAILLAEKGFHVCVNYRQDDLSAQQVVARILAQGGQAMMYKADVTNEHQVIELFDATERALGRVNYLVNNAGKLQPQSRLVDMSFTRFTQMLADNVSSCFLCCREYLRRIQTEGAIVNVSSVAARTGSPSEYVDYAAAKGAMDTLTRGLALEVATQGIRVNGVRPGFIHTSMHRDGGEPKRVERLAPQIPLQRGGTPEEVASAIAWLLSEQASYVTGSFIDIAGGK